MRSDEITTMTGKDVMLLAFDRLFDKAAAKLHVECSADDKVEAKRVFTERFATVLDVAGAIPLSEIPADVMQEMEDAIDHLSSAQVVGHLAAVPLAHQTQKLARAVAHRAAEQRLLEHLINQADDSYGGN